MDPAIENGEKYKAAIRAGYVYFCIDNEKHHIASYEHKPIKGSYKHNLIIKICSRNLREIPDEKNQKHKLMSGCECIVFDDGAASGLEKKLN